MKTSEQIDKLAEALAKAQGTFTNPERNRAVKVRLKENKGEYTFHYTTLDRIIDMIRPGMSANGLAFTQSVGLDTDWVIVTTRIVHASGQWIEDELPVRPDGFGPQQVGSAITYGKRYSLTALLGIASDEDDDGNLGSGHTSEEIKNNPPPKRTKAQQVAAQHGMKTADQLPPIQPQKSAYEIACETIDKALASGDTAKLALCETRVLERHKDGSLTDQEYQDLVGRLAKSPAAA